MDFAGNQPRAVGKRTPRVPVRYTYDKDNIGRYISPVRQGLKKLDVADEDVAHEVALALAEASHRGGSPQISQTPNKRREVTSKLPVGLGERLVTHDLPVSLYLGLKRFLFIKPDRLLIL